MSCVHYQQSNAPKERNYFDGQYTNYVQHSYSPRVGSPETYRNGCYAGWRTLDFQGNTVEPSTAVRSDALYGDPTRIQTGRVSQVGYKQEPMKHGDSFAIEKLQTKMKFLEDSNIVMQSRNQNLITENKALATHLKEERNEVKKLEKRLTSLMKELDAEKLQIEDMTRKMEQIMNKDTSMMRAKGTSTTNIVTTTDRGVQIWAMCLACQGRVESCKKQPPTVTITKSELEVLEKDMQTLRDTIIAREEAWDKAVEREQNYRQQLTRLTTETITARHLSETRYEELKALTNTLSEKEAELRSLQKDNTYLNKLIAKLYRGQEGSQRSNLAVDVNEKDQKFIEDIVRRVSSGKGKQRPKSKSFCSDRSPNSGVYHHNPRERNVRTAKDQAGCLKEPKH